MASSSKHFSTTPVSILKNRSAFSTSRDDGADGKLTGVLDEGAQGGDSMSTPQNTRKVSFNQEADHIKIFEKGSSFNSDTSAGCTPNSSNYSRSSDSSPPEVINETLEDEDDLDMSIFSPKDRKGDAKAYVQAFVIDSPLPDVDTSQSIMGTSDEEPETCPLPEKRKKKMRKARSTTLPESNSRPLDFPPTRIKLNATQQYQQRSLQTSRSRADLEPQPGPSRKANTSINIPIKIPNAHAYRIARGAGACTSTRTSHSFGPFASTITPKRHRRKEPKGPDERPVAASPPPIPLEVKTPETEKFPSPSPNPVMNTPFALPNPASYSYKTPDQPIRRGIICDDPQPKRKIVSAINTPSNNISSMRRHHRQTLESIPENIPDESQSQNVSSPSSSESTDSRKHSYENDSSMESGSSLAEQLEDDDSSLETGEEGEEHSTEVIEDDVVSAMSMEHSHQELSSLEQNNNDNNNDVNNNIDISAASTTQLNCSNSHCTFEYLDGEIQRFIQSYSDDDDDPIRMYCFMRVLEIQLAKLPEVEFNTILDRYSTFFGETYTNAIHSHRRMYTAAVGCRLRRLIYGPSYGLSTNM